MTDMLRREAIFTLAHPLWRHLLFCIAAGILALLVIATGFYLLSSQVSCHKHNGFHTVMVYEDKRSCGCYIRTREAFSSLEEFAFA
jgi:hypothetical protein